jgi:16S rRNA C967 or C1407 C5-methylase (RsmB/RsmF family)
MAKPTLEDFKERLDNIDSEIFTLLSAKKEYFSFRLNLHKATASEVVAALKKDGFKPIELKELTNCYMLPIDDRKRVTKTTTYTDGLIYIQSLSSIYAALELGVKKSDWVLDLAAAPGGKSLIFSEIANRVSAVEPDKSRFFAMKRNFKKMGAKNIQTYNKDGRFVYKATREWFDKVFLDAPCSSEAHIDIKKGITWWSTRRIYKFAKLQKELIVSAFESLKCGGEMIYATCTFAPEENEAVVNYLLKKYPNAKVVAPSTKLPNIKSGITSWYDEEYSSELKKSVRILPNKAYSGFFFCKIKKD